MLKVGIFGTGRMAEMHANSLKQINNAELWSVGSHGIERAKEFAKKHIASAKENAFDDLSAMLSDPELDAVIIATLSALHAEHILLSAKAGKSIFVEKPVCTSLEFESELIASSQQNEITIAVGYNLRWHKGLRKIAEKAYLGELGEIQHMRVHWAVDLFGHKWNFRPQQGPWLCSTVLGTHLIDMVKWIMVPTCGNIIGVKSYIKKIPSEKEFDGALSLMMEFESGATVEIFCSILFDSPFKLEIYSDKKHLIGSDLMNQSQPGSILINNQPLYYELSNQYIDELNNFVECIIKKTEPEVSLREGLNNVGHLVSIWDQNSQ